MDLLNVLMVTKKYISFLSEDEEIIIKYDKIWIKKTKTYGLKLDSQSVYDKKCIKTKLKTYDDQVNTVIPDKEIPKEKAHYSCIAAICIEFVQKLNEENYHQVYLEQCRYKQEKKKLIDFTDAE